MKTQAMDPAKTAVGDCLYPFKTLLVEQGYPSAKHFRVERDGGGVRARVGFDGRVRIARVSGYAVNERRTRTLQLSARIHLYDSWFCGLLRHSCNPNVFFDTTYLERWTVQPIPAGAPSPWLFPDMFLFRSFITLGVFTEGFIRSKQLF